MADYIETIRSLIGPRPLIIVGSTIIVRNEANQVLLQLRSDTFEWGLPGGAMEPGENLIDTARRELYEETGLRAKRLAFIDILSGSHLYFKYPHGDEVYNVIAVFQAEGVYDTLKINDDESMDLKYFDLNDLPRKLDERARLIINDFVN